MQTRRILGKDSGRPTSEDRFREQRKGPKEIPRTRRSKTTK
jgi:hypothetical protein